jgi:N-acetyl sugar amidotransferase
MTLPSALSAPAARHSRPYQICSRCIMDTSDVEITFDAEGRCNSCLNAEALIRDRLPHYKTGEYQVDRIVARIREAGRHRPYDCICGVSGGVDSTYATYQAKRLGLRPLAVHFDNGWNSELAVQNIEQAVRRLDIPLYTHVVDWEEFRDLQLSFLRASVSDAEIPTDHGIWALLYGTAARFGVRYIISGTNLSTESILPRSWTYYVSDWTYIEDIHRRFGTRPLRTYPHARLSRFVWWVLGRRIRTVSLLNSLHYDKEEALATLERELGYRRYGGKHHESLYTRFFQEYILPRKFGIDKRRAHLSSLIMSAQVTRDEALRQIERQAGDPEQIDQDLRYVVKKLGLVPEQFEEIMAAPVRTYRDYRNDSRGYEVLKRLMRSAQRRGFLPAQVGM